MLVIRLQRTGRRSSPAYRIVVAEHSAPIKGKTVEVVGHFIPNRSPEPELVYKEERITHWISQGAQPTDTMARLLSKAGVKNLEKYIKRYTKQSPRKEVEEQDTAPADATPAKEESTDSPAPEEKAEDKAADKEAPPAEEKAEDKPEPEEKTEEVPTEERAGEPAKEEVKKDGEASAEAIDPVFDSEGAQTRGEDSSPEREKVDEVPAKEAKAETADNTENQADKADEADKEASKE